MMKLNVVVFAMASAFSSYAIAAPAKSPEVVKATEARDAAKRVLLVLQVDAAKAKIAIAEANFKLAKAKAEAIKK